MPSRTTHRSLFTFTLALLVLAGQGEAARAQSRLELDYAISYARIPIGSARLAAEIGDEEYNVTLHGRAAGAARVLTSGEGEFLTHGAVRSGELAPEGFRSTISSGDDKLSVRMVLADGNVTELDASAMGGARVPLTEGDRQGVIDPLTALLLSTGTGEAAGERACPRTLPVFDGHRRYDLKLGFKRDDKIKLEKGYSGAVAVCSLEYRPIAGHYTSDPLVKFLSSGREMEVALAPVASAHLLAPVRLSVSGTLANLIILATRLEVTTMPSTGASQSKPSPPQ